MVLPQILAVRQADATLGYFQNTRSLSEASILVLGRTADLEYVVDKTFVKSCKVFKALEMSILIYPIDIPNILFPH